ncbi:SDR family oxidoreductase [Mycolicibacterium pulveris]|uniref:Short-chain dehydrogenase n=1 Tax=Mycolicibacterium pulveris TaxID=36813 RepID=A0A7I7UPY6_MYCPV|nr:SDR family oxidoreductase [Mycolicibacterium pulveris]MCV6983528.1 SDR family oxidoreductase [Mycolicibacterium pulveris]BBY83407.1 short-chain dehydrogenase [Mycolicibacterium pulveris]
MDRFTGKVAIVTGGGSGIGEATARRLAAEGALVVVADVIAERCEAVAKSIVADGGVAAAKTVDVTSRATVDDLVESTLDTHGQLDVMVNNAGLGSIGPLTLLSDETLDNLLNINIKGVVHGTAAAGRVMQGSNTGGAIVNTSSAAATFGSPFQAVYSATKGAVLSLTRSAAMEFAPTIRVNAVCPGGVRTRFMAAATGMDVPPEMDEVAGKVHPLGRMGEAHEIASAIAFLASADATFITGVGLPVDGGMTAGALIDLG